MGQFGHARSFPDASKRDIAGASLDTLYSMAWHDLSHGPYVLQLPDASDRFCLMPVIDGWAADGFYPIARFDGSGRVLNGSNGYVMHFTVADIPPIHPRGFWSITLYDAEYFLVPNAINRYSLSPRDPLQRNPDGSIDLYFQKEFPGSDKESNWLPAPGGDFILMMRVYWPKDEVLDGTWVPPAVRRSDEA